MLAFRCQEKPWNSQLNPNEIKLKASFPPQILEPNTEKSHHQSYQKLEPLQSMKQSRQRSRIVYD